MNGATHPIQGAAPAGMLVYAPNAYQLGVPPQTSDAGLQYHAPEAAHSAGYSISDSGHLPHNAAAPNSFPGPPIQYECAPTEQLAAPQNDALSQEPPAAPPSLSEALVTSQCMSSDAQDRLNRWLAQDQCAVEKDPEIVAKLFSRIRHNRCSEAQELIDATGVDLDVRDENGNSPLMIAAQNGHKKMAKMLMRRRIDLNAQNCHGQTPLHFCYKFGHVKLAEYLSSKGANEQVRDYDGITPRQLYLAARQSSGYNRLPLSVYSDPCLFVGQCADGDRVRKNVVAFISLVI